jgi:hypothetical protein
MTSSTLIDQPTNLETKLKDVETIPSKARQLERFKDNKKQDARKNSIETTICKSTQTFGRGKETHLNTKNDNSSTDGALHYSSSTDHQIRHQWQKIFDKPNNNNSNKVSEIAKKRYSQIKLKRSTPIIYRLAITSMKITTGSHYYFTTSMVSRTSTTGTK